MATLIHASLHPVPPQQTSKKEKIKNTLLLLSGGIDSPVAGYLLKKQHLTVAAVHFSMEPIVDKHAELKSKRLAEMLGFSPFYVVPFGKTLELIANICEHRYYFIIMRRMMYRIATALAERDGYQTIATGENLGQVGSQTLHNLACIDRATRLLVLRPILCNDKIETIRIAEKIGTLEISKGPEICAVLGPKHPATRSKVEKILEEEKKIDVQRLVDELVHAARREDLLIS